MSLIKCTECGKEYSNKAASCPNCGCPTELNEQQENITPVIAEQDTTENPPERTDLDTPNIDLPTTDEHLLKSVNKRKLAIILIVVLLVTISAGAYIYSEVNYSAGQEAIEKSEYKLAIEKFGHSFHNGSKEKITLAKDLIVSNNEYILGDNLWDVDGFSIDLLKDNSKMEEALQHFENVIPEDKNYDKSQKAIKDLKDFIELEKNKNKAILLAKKSNAISDYDTSENIINSWIANNNTIFTVYGWDAVYAFKREPILTGTSNNNEPDKSLYFVSYGFDDDDDLSNGNRLYCFEVNIDTGVVRYILGNTALEKKYEDWGYIE